jgi:Flp pilus assembly protein CpaB
MFRRKLPPSSVLYLVLAVVSGLAAVLVIRAYARQIERTRPDAGPPRAVVVAAHDLVRGTTLAPDMVRDATVPAAFTPPGAEASAPGVTGRVLSSDVASGEVITAQRLAGSHVGPVAAVIPAGLRGAVIPSGLPPGAVAPGDSVDVLATFGGGRSHVESVADGVEVAKVIGAAAPSGVAGSTTAAEPSLVLLVEPSTAEELAYASAFATLTVIIEPAPSFAPSPEVSG